MDFQWGQRHGARGCLLRRLGVGWEPHMCLFACGGFRVPVPCGSGHRMCRWLLPTKPIAAKTMAVTPTRLNSRSRRRWPSRKRKSPARNASEQLPKRSGGLLSLPPRHCDADAIARRGRVFTQQARKEAEKRRREEGQKMIEAREVIEKRNRMAEYERRKKVLCGG